MLRVGAIDPGKRNFAFAILCFDLRQATDLVLPKKKDRYTSTGEPSAAFLAVLDRIWRLPYTVDAIENVQLETKDKGYHVGNETLIALTGVLDRYLQLWDACDMILIEKQMGFGKAHNTLGLRIAQHCLSYFLIRYATFKSIVEYPAYNKTQILGAPKGLSKPQRKKWAIEKAKQILSIKDASALTKWSTFKKKDDVSDCVCMCFSYLIGDVFT
jgi:hypothetical protein